MDIANPVQFLTLSVSPHINDVIFRLRGYCFSDPLDLSQADDDQHDYDSVASDEDTDSELTAQNNNNTQRNNRAKVSSSKPLLAH